jgi:hypothetical protein
VINRAASAAHAVIVCGEIIRDEIEAGIRLRRDHPGRDRSRYSFAARSSGTRSKPVFVCGEIIRDEIGAANNRRVDGRAVHPTPPNPLPS